MRAVCTAASRPDRLTIHLLPLDGNKTRCGQLAVKEAPMIVNRSQMCKFCFGKDYGLSCWSASRLGLERIKENG